MDSERREAESAGDEDEAAGVVARGTVLQTLDTCLQHSEDEATTSNICYEDDASFFFECWRWGGSGIDCSGCGGK